MRNRCEITRRQKEGKLHPLITNMLTPTHRPGERRGTEKTTKGTEKKSGQ